jgi:hypothetical protein
MKINQIDINHIAFEKLIDSENNVDYGDLINLNIDKIINSKKNKIRCHNNTYIIYETKNINYNHHDNTNKIILCVYDEYQGGDIIIDNNKRYRMKKYDYCVVKDNYIFENLKSGSRIYLLMP